MKRNLATALILGLSLLALGVVILSTGGLGEQEYRSFPSPDGRFHIVVFRERSLSAMMPGQSGDSPGAVKLVDRNGKVLQMTKVDMVQLVDRVNWTQGQVAIKLVADWDLPQQ
jgi:hypothetical protein